MDAVRTNNFLVNSLMLPGMFVNSTYTYDDFPHMDLADPAVTEVPGEILRNEYKPRVKFTDQITRSRTNTTYPLRLIYIPVDFTTMSIADRLSNSPGSHIPAVLQVANRNAGSSFVIHFHGNACDAAQVGAPARVESRMFNAHYLVVEYPGYGLASGGSSESMLNSIAFSAYLYVVKELQVPPEKVIIYGRSIGVGVAVALAARLSALKLPPAALILHSPYTSIRDVAQDALGKTTFLFQNRWENWRPLCHKDKPSGEGAASIAESATVGGNSAASAGVKDVQLKFTKLLTDAEIAQLPAQYADALPTTIPSPVLFIHADHDQIIDYHHSTTLNMRRSRAGLPTELYTQRSNHDIQKDHNVFDYEQDVINPISAFLKKHGLAIASSDAGQRSSVEDSDAPRFIKLDLAVVTKATIPTGAHLQQMSQIRESRLLLNEANRRKEEEQARVAAAAKQPASDGKTPASFLSPKPPLTGSDALRASSTSDARSKSADKPAAGPTSVVGLICSNWSRGKCARCCLFCLPCFCIECTCSCCETACSAVYYRISSDEPDFEYTTRKQRRMSGGLATPDVVTTRSSIGELRTTQPPTKLAANDQSSAYKPPYTEKMDRAAFSDDGSRSGHSGQSSREVSVSSVRDVESSVSSTTGAMSFLSRTFDQKLAPAVNTQGDTDKVLEAIGETRNPMVQAHEPVAKPNVPIYLPG